MIVKKLLESLQSLASVIEASGSKKSAEAVSTSANLLPSDDQRDASEALAELRQVLAEDNQRLRNTYVDRLHAAGTDEASFKLVYQDLSSDKLIGKGEADEIAHRFTGGRKKWSSRKAAVEAIHKKFVERAYQASKMEIVEKYKVG